MRTYRQMRRDHARLGGLGFYSLNSSEQMVYGAPYVFHFKWGGLGLKPGISAISQQIAQDSNFQSPAAAEESGGVQVQFTYAGQGSNVVDAGAEMQNVINTWGLMGSFNGLYFVAAEGGSSGAQTTSPGDNQSSLFNGGSLGTLAIGAGIGSLAAAIGLGLLAYRLLR